MGRARADNRYIPAKARDRHHQQRGAMAGCFGVTPRQERPARSRLVAFSSPEWVVSCFQSLPCPLRSGERRRLSTTRYRPADICTGSPLSDRPECPASPDFLYTCFRYSVPTHQAGFIAHLQGGWGETHICVLSGVDYTMRSTNPIGENSVSS